jgi:hypothetical protein
VRASWACVADETCGLKFGLKASRRTQRYVVNFVSRNFETSAGLLPSRQKIGIETAA